MAAQSQGDGGDAGQADGNGFDGPDVSALAEQFGSLSEGQEEMRQILAGLQEHVAQAQEDGPGPPPLDLDASDLEHAGDDPGDPFGDPEQHAQQLAGHVAAVMDAHVAPIREELGDLRRSHDAAQLISEFFDQTYEPSVRAGGGPCALRDHGHTMPDARGPTCLNWAPRQD